MMRRVKQRGAFNGLWTGLAATAAVLLDEDKDRPAAATSRNRLFVALAVSLAW